MDFLPRQCALLGVWLTILAIAVGGAIAPPSRLHAAQQQPSAASEPPCPIIVTTCGGQSASRDAAPRDASGGPEVAKRGEGCALLAVSSSARLVMGLRLKAVGSPILEKPQADRHLLLALERSAATSSTAHLPLLRSTHLRI